MSKNISYIELASILGCENEEVVLNYDSLIERLQKMNIPYGIEEYDYDEYHSEKTITIRLSAVTITARYNYWNLYSSCSDGYELDTSNIQLLN